MASDAADRDDALPPGLLEELRADTRPPVRPAEVARALRALKVVSLDDSQIIDAIVDVLLNGSQAERVATS